MYRNYTVKNGLKHGISTPIQHTLAYNFILAGLEFINLSLWVEEDFLSFLNLEAN